MVIGYCGYGYSGSGAVRDLLREYDNLQICESFEFSLPYWPDSISDLEYHLIEQPNRFFSSDVAISRFKTFVRREMRSPHGWYNVSTKGKFGEITHRYINSIVQLTWTGRSMLDPFMVNQLERTIKYRIIAKMCKKFTGLTSFADMLLDREFYFSIAPDDFLNKTKDYFNEVLESMGFDTKRTIFLDQPFPANNPVKCMRYFDSAKAIIIKKDPRDTYLLMKKKNVKWAPISDPKSFVSYYRQLYRNDYDDTNILYISFEDMIYKYQATIQTIEEFCNLTPEQHIEMHRFFNPELSSANTKLFLNTVYNDDVSYIERELKEFLYDFK